ncbi:Non-specific serine/threonine protein kinase protein [Dioscorea alata]|uniref:Non-specific serine/threonine protein kinase protein n=1 Tax=Dioscorea alata TaxID=55571 RepID=A0ACB7WTC7_DIOAL|nr:Non-specific serine/threonine protein kinase protein [Dioscorea alata]
MSFHVVMDPGAKDCIETERTTLLSIKASIWNNNNNNQNFLSSWISHDCCYWKRVSCNHETSHITKLHLDLSMNNFIDSPIPEFIGSFANLEYLNLSHVGFSGIILYTLGNLSCLASLQAGGNHDTTLFHHLNFTSLHVLDLSQNYDLNITHHLWLLHLTSLVHLDLFDCVLYGKLPVTIGNLSNLRVLSLSDSFDGEIPKSLGNLVQGWMPTSIGDLRNLQYLDLSTNMLSGTISESFGNLTLLQQFYVFGGSHLSEKLLETIGNLVHLQFLYLFENAISGKLPKSLGNLSQLQQLRILTMLDLSNNNINGTMPKGMGNLCKLDTFDLTSNSISGGIDDLVNGLPKCMENKNGSDLGISNGLNTLSLGNNKLKGTVPESIGQLSHLIKLNLSSNSLSGTLTESHFLNLVSLESLDFSYNSLHLNVSENWMPHFDCQFIRMCSCNVGPVFLTWVETQTQMKDHCLSDAGISGNIPAWFWNPGSSSYYSLNLSNNNLGGSCVTLAKLACLLQSPK